MALLQVASVAAIYRVLKDEGLNKLERNRIMLLNQVREQTNFFEQRAESQNWSKFKKYSDDDPR